MTRTAVKVHHRFGGFARPADAYIHSHSGNLRNGEHSMHVHSDLYIGGRWVPATSTDVIEVVNPATEEVIATVPAASTDDADAAVRAARAAFNSWSQLTVDERVDYVERIAAAMAARAEEIAPVVSAEQGMPMTNAPGAIGAPHHGDEELRRHRPSVRDRSRRRSGTPLSSMSRSVSAPSSPRGTIHSTRSSARLRRRSWRAAR